MGYTYTIYVMEVGHHKHFRLQTTIFVFLTHPDIRQCLVVQSSRVAWHRKHSYTRWNCVAIVFTSCDIRYFVSTSGSRMPSLVFHPHWRRHVLVPLCCAMQKICGFRWNFTYIPSPMSSLSVSGYKVMYVVKSYSGKSKSSSPKSKPSPSPLILKSSNPSPSPQVALSSSPVQVLVHRFHSHSTYHLRKGKITYLLHITWPPAQRNVRLNEKSEIHYNCLWSHSLQRTHQIKHLAAWLFNVNNNFILVTG